MPAHEAASLVNLTGFTAGTALYAMLLAMVLRQSLAGAGPETRRPIDRLLLATALLGLTWNLEAFIQVGLADFAVPRPHPIVQAAAYTALGLLPSVVVHSVVRAGIGGAAAAAVVAIGYGLGLAAGVLQFLSVGAHGIVPAPAALQLLTLGFLVLGVPLAFMTRGQPGARRALWMTALAVFAVSALHLTRHETVQEAWFVELIGHHASIPLAVAILYQEYPFALADLFLKRALALVGLIGVVLAGYVALAAWAPGGLPEAGTELSALLFIGVAIATSLVYPFLRRGAAWFVDTVVLRRSDYEVVRAGLARALQQCDSVEAALEATVLALGPALNASDIGWSLLPAAPAGDPVVSVPSRGTTARVTVPTAETPRYVLEIGGLTGGRRLLSDDEAMLDAVGHMLARRVDALRRLQERYEQTVREQEIQRLASEAELRALRAQINPHFLFNALTTIGYLIRAAPDRALDTLLRLTELLRRVLRSDEGQATLGSELSVVKAYLDIEQARFEERLQVFIDVPAELHDAPVPPLVVQPLVENAIKHGIAPRRSGGRISITAGTERSAGGRFQLWIRVQDTGNGASAVQLAKGRRIGVGLNNVEQRLRHAFGAAASLAIDTRPGDGTIVEVRLPLETAPGLPASSAASGAAR